MTNDEIYKIVAKAAYTEWSIYYSKQNWIYSYPCWEDIDKATQEWWVDLMKTVLKTVKAETLLKRSNKGEDPNVQSN